MKKGKKYFPNISSRNFMIEFIAQKDERCKGCDCELPAGSVVYIDEGDGMYCNNCCADREEYGDEDIDE